MTFATTERNANEPQQGPADALPRGVAADRGIARVYDGYSARLVERLGFKAASMTGAGLSNPRLSQPDIGYGHPVTVHYTVQFFEEASVVGINIQDQVSPKRFVDAVQAPVSINMGFGIRSRPTTPLIPVQRLQELDVARVSYAHMLPAAAIMGMTRHWKCSAIAP
jgi:2-methylisocitrate lyase-like PEP mutase family enzyme